MRYQIRCVCGHLSAFEIIPMPVVPSHRDMKISDEPPNRVAHLETANADLLEACKDIVFCIEDCEECEGMGIDPRCEIDDACRGCGGVGKNLSSDGIFAAFKAQETIRKHKGEVK